MTILHKIAPPRVIPDHCSESGAKALAARIKSYWAAKGIHLDTWIEADTLAQAQETHQSLIFSVRSSWPPASLAQ